MIPQRKKQTQYKQSKIAILVVGLSFLVISLFSAPPLAIAQDTEVGATLCSADPPEITVYAPEDGVIAANQTIMVEGVVQRASSVTVQINGEIAATIPIAFSGPFSTEAALIPGTNMIQVDAYLSCNATDASTTFFVWYNTPPLPPDPTPGNPPSNSPLETIVGNIKDNLGGITHGNGALPDGTNTGQVTTPVISYVVLTRSWISLILAISMLAFLLLPERYYRRKGIAGRRMLTLRIVAFFLWLLFLFILQL